MSLFWIYKGLGFGGEGFGFSVFWAFNRVFIEFTLKAPRIDKSGNRGASIANGIL